MYVADLASGLQTGDAGAAFMGGANVVVNRAHLPKLGDEVRAGIKARDEQYRVYLAALEAAEV